MLAPRATERSRSQAAEPARPEQSWRRAKATRALLFGIELCREMGASKAFAELRERELMPGNLGPQQMREWVRQSVTTYFHPAGSCAMGVGDDAVVDPRLMVRGVEGLRVADASIMPFVTTGNTNAPSIMIGERAAQMVIEDAS